MNLANKKGLRFKEEKEWDYQSIRKLLTNPVYKGERIFHSKGEPIIRRVPEIQIVSDSTWDSVQRRIKEIGVRKVLGASMSSIVSLLSRHFIKLVLIANAIAWPLAWFTINKWMEGYAYRLPMSWWVFILAGFMALVIALATVSLLAMKAAAANPVTSLRSE